MFYLYAQGELIGHSDLEAADAAMSCACGIFHANENYHKLTPIIRRYSAQVERSNTGNQDDYIKAWDEVVALNLIIKTESGETLEPVGGVSLLDYAEELEEESGRELSVLGLPSEQFMRCFPEAYEWYQNQ